MFDHEPEKYAQAWMPPQQIFQGNCGGATVPDVLKYYNFRPEDGGEFLHSEDYANWRLWKGETRDEKAA